MSRVTISEDVIVGPPPENEETVRGLAREGFRSILNLRPMNSPAAFSSRKEGVAATEDDLTYLNYPISGDDLDEFHVRAFRTKLKLLPKPVFVHGEDSSRRAAALGLIDLAMTENWTGQQALQKAVELGIEIEDPVLRESVVRHIDGRQEQLEEDQAP